MYSCFVAYIWFASSVSVDVSDFMANGSNNRVVTATGTDAMNAEANMTFDGTNLLVSDDTAGAYANIGRTRVGYTDYTDYAHISHRDLTSAGQYALLQSATGDTFINAASGRTLHLRINNSSIASITSTGFNNLYSSIISLDALNFFKRFIICLIITINCFCS